MRVTCLFFAAYRDIVGAEELEFELPDNSTVARLVASLHSRVGAGALPVSLVVAVNQVYAESDKILRDGDEVAFIPPVAGG